MSDLSIPKKGHPKGLYVLFATEMWERFNYYGMRAILVYFMMDALLYNKPFASNLYGGYTGLIYLSPLIGGYIADRYSANRYTANRYRIANRTARSCSDWILGASLS